jgi:putative ABC transport system ATP-binding protein
MNLAIQATELSKHYKVGKNDYVRALGPINLEIPEQSFTIIIGRSGSGKSTLLNLLTGLDKPTNGELIVDGKYLSRMNRSNMAKYRSSIGIIFQQYNLLPTLTATENILMGSWAGKGGATKEDALKLLERFNLSHRADARVTTLSGGEKQRVAVCRALIAKPSILFCDEPTGALDSQNEENVRDILLDLHKDGLTIVMVTHNLDFQDIGTQVLRLDDGLLSTLKSSDEMTSTNAQGQQIIVRKYDKSIYDTEDLWLFRDFLDNDRLREYLSSELPEEDLKLNEVTLLGLKSIIQNMSNQYPGKRVFPFGFLPIARDPQGGLIVYFVEDNGVYYLDREIFFENNIRLVHQEGETTKTYETQSIVTHAQKVFENLDTFLQAVLNKKK